MQNAAKLPVDLGHDGQIGVTLTPQHCIERRAADRELVQSFPWAEQSTGLNGQARPLTASLAGPRFELFGQVIIRHRQLTELRMQSVNLCPVNHCLLRRRARLEELRRSF